MVTRIMKRTNTFVLNVEETSSGAVSHFDVTGFNAFPDRIELDMEGNSEPQVIPCEGLNHVLVIDNEDERAFSVAYDVVNLLA